MKYDLSKLENSPRDMAHWQKAQKQLLAGRSATALAAYRHLVKRFPGTAQLWLELGMAASAELEFDAADAALSSSMELAGQDTSVLTQLAIQYQRLRRLDRARECFERAAAADPASISANVNLAQWYEKERRLEDAWACMESCLERHPQNARVLYLRAFLCQRGGRSAEAEMALRELIQRDAPDPSLQSWCRYLLAEVLDHSGRYAEAMRWLLEAKTHARQTADVKQLEGNQSLMAQRQRDLLQALTPENLRRWREEVPAPAFPFQLALLGGHPRSGTTLLEQILDAHDEVMAIDESEAFLNEVWNQLAPVNAPRALTMKDLDALTPAQRKLMRQRYLKSLLRETGGEPRGSVVLDKNPHTTLVLPIWLRIFPDLKIIIALRDPRDVVISCFFQNLTLTMGNVDFLSLERTVKHYCEFMDIWLRLRDLNGFDWVEVRYRDLVADLEAEGRRVTEFLGLAWDSCQSRFHESAVQKFVFAPTYEGVTQPLHERARGRWRNYAEALAPHLERLKPYCRALRYEDD
jgi:tetratricopeptide (TPR) repeat protein